MALPTAADATDGLDDAVRGCRFPNFGPGPEDAPLGQATDAVMRLIASRRAERNPFRGCGW
jgi:hypothetical protein